jgi:hypothetical protein
MQQKAAMLLKRHTAHLQDDVGEKYGKRRKQMEKN